jgi:LysR family hydrogen peroxide-inducible transcriptional activator
MTTLRQLRFLVALADTGSFSRAAEQCHVTQSTLSAGLKELEARLGVQVAERTTHAVMMTPIGTDLAARGRDILARVADFEDRAKAEVGAGATMLKLGAIPTVGPYLLPRILPMLRANHPETRFYLREELTDQLVDGLLDGRLDLLLIALPHDLPSTITTDLLFEDNYSVATPRTHPLANVESIEGKDLQGRDLLLLERGHCLQQHALSSVPGVDLNQDDTFSATSLSTLTAMVEEGLGVTLLPHLAIGAGLAKGHNLHLAHLVGATPRQIVLAWRKSSPKAALFHEIAQSIRAVGIEATEPH